MVPPARARTRSPVLPGKTLIDDPASQLRAAHRRPGSLTICHNDSVHHVYVHRKCLRLQNSKIGYPKTPCGVFPRTNAIAATRGCGPCGRPWPSCPRDDGPLSRTVSQNTRRGGACLHPYAIQIVLLARPLSANVSGRERTDPVSVLGELRPSYLTRNRTQRAKILSGNWRVGHPGVTGKHEARGRLHA
jgi:hypothetical protein